MSEVSPEKKPWVVNRENVERWHRESYLHDEKPEKYWKSVAFKMTQEWLAKDDMRQAEKPWYKWPAVRWMADRL